MCDFGIAAVVAFSGNEENGGAFDLMSVNECEDVTNQPARGAFHQHLARCPELFNGSAVEFTHFSGRYCFHADRIRAEPFLSRDFTTEHTEVSHG